MNLINIDDVVITRFLDSIHNLFDTILKVTTILRSCQKRSHIELVNLTAFQPFRHLTLLNQPYKSPDQCRLADTRFTYMQRVVLVTATQNLNGTLQFLFSSDEGIILSVVIVHAGHQFLPCCLSVSFRSFLFHLVI